MFDVLLSDHNLRRSTIIVFLCEKPFSTEAHKFSSLANGLLASIMNVKSMHRRPVTEVCSCTKRLDRAIERSLPFIISAAIPIMCFGQKDGMSDRRVAVFFAVP
jgi:hypothetical protein